MHQKDLEGRWLLAGTEADAGSQHSHALSLLHEGLVLECKACASCCRLHLHVTVPDH
jgi:hypothetical protein